MQCKNYLFLLLLAPVFVSCKKEENQITLLPTEPETEYTDLGDKMLEKHQSIAIDIDKDGTKDFAFTTWYIGDPLAKLDKVLFFAASTTHSLLYSGDNNNSPIYQKDALIRKNNSNGYGWYEVAQIELAQLNIGETDQPYWTGEWKAVSHKYLAIQVKRGAKRYTGWIELSFNMQEERLVLHKAAISKIPETDIKAGM